MDALNSLFAKLEKKQASVGQAKKPAAKPQKASSSTQEMKPVIPAANETTMAAAATVIQPKKEPEATTSTKIVASASKPAVSTPSVQTANTTTNNNNNLTKKPKPQQQQQQQQQSSSQQHQLQQVEPMIIEQPTLFKLDKPGLYGKLDAREYATLQNGAEIIEEIVSDGFKYRNKIDNKAFLIEKFHNQLNQGTKYRKKELESVIGKKALKQVGFFGIPKTALKHDTFLPMNTLWKTYIRQLIPNDLTDDSGHAKFLKADLHGAVVRVLSSKCDTYEGLEGIVLQEKLRSFRVITHEDRIPSDRIKQKFKMKAASEFVLSQS